MMKLKLIILGSVLLNCSILSSGKAQTYYPGKVKPTEEFQKTFGGKDDDDAYGIIQTPDNGYMTVGTTASFGSGKSDVYVNKLDSTGNLEWSKAYGGLEDDYGRAIVHSGDGNVFVMGYTSSFDAEFKQIYVLKLNYEGNVLWSKTFGLDRSDYGTSMASTSDGGVVILGETINDINGPKNSDILLIKLTKDGTIEWSKIYGGKSTDYGYSVSQTSDGGFIVGGETNSFGAGEWDCYLLKLDKDGKLEWSKTYGESKTDYGRVARQTSDGGYLMVGNTFNFGGADLDIMVVKTDAKGDIQWAKMYGGEKTEYVLNVDIKDKHVLLSGYTNSFGISVEDAFLLCMDENGKVSWGKTYGGVFDDHAISATITNNGGVIFSGRTASFGVRKGDAFVVRTTLKYSNYLCNAKFFMPLIRNNLKVKTSSGAYEYDVHIIPEDVDTKTVSVVTAEQILCTPHK